ncbi:hypothetical protein HPP92_019907 [Vanilla planifolia]|uniref:Uncharacterized protein n=1 Tax=Vanilla planifolia TaxID=51239 RepID=A0A835ULD7_VANPL|nr:hypothetical protein HPP92_019907 [Vanilla planifolia]
MPEIVRPPEMDLSISPTSSRSVTETVNGSHKFVIQVGRLLYPDGKNPEDNTAYVSVFIALASEGTDVGALFELTLVDQSGKGSKVHSHFDRSLESGPYTLKYRGSMWSIVALIGSCSMFFEEVKTTDGSWDFSRSGLEIGRRARYMNVNDFSKAVITIKRLNTSRRTAPSLQSELLKIIAGCEECSSGGKSRSVWAGSL